MPACPMPTPCTTTLHDGSSVHRQTTRDLGALRAPCLREQPAHARERARPEPVLAGDREERPQVVADPRGAVVEAREVRLRSPPVGIGPVRPPQSAVGVLRDAEEEVAGGDRRVAVPVVSRDRVSGEQPFADGRRAHVPVGLEVGRLDRRAPRPAPLGHRAVAGDQRVAPPSAPRAARVPSAFPTAAARSPFAAITGMAGDVAPRTSMQDRASVRWRVRRLDSLESTIRRPWLQWSGHEGIGGEVLALTCGLALVASACGSSKEAAASRPPRSRRPARRCRRRTWP